VKQVNPEQHTSKQTAPYPVRELFLASTTALFIELLFIRWLSSEIPIFAYFKNFPLLAAFIGLGVGSLISESRKFYWVSSCWTFCLLTAMVTFSSELHLHDLKFPEPNIDFWDLPFSEKSPIRIWIKNFCLVFFILGCCTWSFVGPGQAVGKLIKSGPPLRMYTFDILGSLVGVLAFAFLSSLYSPPTVWVVIAVVLLWIVGIKLGISRFKQALPLGFVILIAGLAYVRTQSSDVIIKWSPYYRIEVKPVYRKVASGEQKFWKYHLNVNQWIHQVMIDLNDTVRGDYVPETPPWIGWIINRLQYDFPFFFKPAPESVLIGGAGSGNDVSGALRNGAKKITAVEIDPGILYFGKELHPARPYASDRVTAVNADIRAFLRRSKEKFDLIIFSILDSHTALSALSSLRLDNYVYTVEGIKDAVNHLKPDGIMCLSFYESNRIWLGERIYSSIYKATGTRPAATSLGKVCAFVFGPGITQEGALKKLYDRNIGFKNTDYLHGKLQVRPSTDDWPFLYSNPRGQPFVYYLSLVLVVIFGGAFVYWGLRSGIDGGGRTRLDLPMFFLGAGFLLIETKGLAEMSLLFGSTWIVNTIVFSGIFIMVLLANWAVSQGANRYTNAAFILEGLSLFVWYVFPRASLNALDFWPRVILWLASRGSSFVFCRHRFWKSIFQESQCQYCVRFELDGCGLGGRD